jgi:hypothetical protein
MASGAEPQAPIRNIFPFSHKPNTLDRDRIVVPAGWDSWGKIAIMRDGFDAKTWGEAWERDLDENQNEGSGARKLFAALVPDQGTKVSIVASISMLLIVPCSQLHSLHSTTLHQNKPSLPKTTTKMRRNQTGILVAHSGTLQTSLQRRLVSWAHLEAVVSVFQLSSVR